MTTPALLHSDLQARPYGSRVTDEDGRTWTRKHLDRWLCEDRPEVVNSAELTVFYGPITVEREDPADTIDRLILALARASGRSVAAERIAQGVPPERTS